MTKSSRREALRRNRQTSRMRELEAKGVDCSKWKDNAVLRNLIIFGKPLPTPQS